MGQYNGKFGAIKYNDGQVNSAKEIMKNGEKQLDGTKAEITKGFSSLASARGIEYINCLDNQTTIENLVDDCVEYIEDLYTSTSNKQKEIEEYRDAPWYKKVFASIAMGLTKFGEGILTAGENIIDAGASLVGFTAGIFGAKDFQDSCAEFIKTDHVGETFEKYVNGSNTWIGKYSSMSPESTGAKLFKGIGVATGYVVAAAATGGAVGALGGSISATAANTVVAAAGGLGAGTETGLQQGKTFNEAFGQGVKQAAIQGATAYAAGKIGEKIQANAAAKANPNQIEGQMSMFDDVANSAKSGTIYENKVMNGIKSGSSRATTAIADKAHTVGEKIASNNVGQKVISAGKSVGNYAGNLADDAIQLGKDALSPVSAIGSKIAGSAPAKALTNLGSKALSTASSVAGKAVNLAAANPVVGNAISAGLVAAPSIINESTQTEIAKLNKDLSAKAIQDATAERIFGEDVINYSFTQDSDPNNNVTNIETPQEGVGPSGTDSGSGYSPSSGSSNGGSSSGSRQGAVSQRISTGGGSSYSPSGNATPVSVGSVKTEPNPLEALNQSSSSSGGSSTPSNGSTGNSSAVQGAISGSNNSSSSSSSQSQTPSSSTPSNQTPGSTTPSTPSNQSTPSTPSTFEPPKSTTSSSSSGTSHSGGGYSDSGYSFAGSSSSFGESTPTDPSEVITPVDNESSVGGTLASSITSTSFKNQTIKIPTTPEATGSSSGTNMVIPTASALSTAAAAGIGVKAYMDHKQNSDNEEETEGEENNGFYSEEWNGTEDDIKVDYGTEDESSLTEDDDYSYSADSIIEKYEAVNNSELEEVQ